MIDIQSQLFLDDLLDQRLEELFQKQSIVGIKSVLSTNDAED